MWLLMKADIFDYICNRIANAIYVGVVPSTQVAEHFNINLYKSRKYIRQLVTDGLLVSKIDVLSYDPFWDEYYPPRIYRGYTLTEAGYQTENYKKHYAEVLESYRRWAMCDA